MAARAMWKAELALGDDVLPVKLYAAVEDRGIHFRLLHARDRTPVQQQMVDPRTEEEVPREEVRRGLEVEEGVFVVLTDDELAQLAVGAASAVVGKNLDPATQSQLIEDYISSVGRN